jgi:hypothetical protein
VSHDAEGLPVGAVCVCRPFTVAQGAGDKPVIRVQAKGEAKTFTPEEISSMVLSKMKEIAEGYLGKEVKNAVSAPRTDKLSTIHDITRCFPTARNAEDPPKSQTFPWSRHCSPLIPHPSPKSRL